MNHGKSELRGCGQRETYADQTVRQQQAVCCRIPLARVRAVRAVDRRKQWIATMGPSKSNLNLCHADTHRLAGDVARRAAASVCPQALEEGIVRIDIAGTIEDAYDSSWIAI
jgi:hypothetical protein